MKRLSSLEKALTKLVSEVYKGKYQHGNPDLKSALENCEMELKNIPQNKQIVLDGIIESFGRPDADNGYDLEPDKDGKWWITHKIVGSGEPFEQFLKEHL
jgi:hypothetical protein